MADIQYDYRLEVKPGDVIWIPGCEPASGVSGPFFPGLIECETPTIHVLDALQAIEGSYIEEAFGMKWYVMPPIDVECPRGCHPDYYKMLMDFISEEEKESPRGCDSFDVFKPCPESGAL